MLLWPKQVLFIWYVAPSSLPSVRNVYRLENFIASFVGKPCCVFIENFVASLSDILVAQKIHGTLFKVQIRSFEVSRQNLTQLKTYFHFWISKSINPGNLSFMSINLDHGTTFRHSNSPKVGWFWERKLMHIHKLLLDCHLARMETRIERHICLYCLYRCTYL